jgi:hypothetical protein
LGNTAFDLFVKPEEPPEANKINCATQNAHPEETPV